MSRKVGLAIALALLITLGGIGPVTADYHSRDDYDEDDWSGNSDFDGSTATPSDSGDETTYDPNPSSTFSGVAIPMQNALQAELGTAVREAESSYPGSSPEVWLFMNEDTTAVVASDSPIQLGEVELQGYKATSGSVSVIVADSVSLDTSPKLVDNDELSGSPTQYQYQYVESTAPVKHVPFAYETGDGNVMQESTTGGFNSDTLLADAGRLVPPTELSNHVLVNASRLLNGGARGLELGEYRLSGDIFLDSHQTDEWIVDSEATVQGVVLDRPVGAPAADSPDDLTWLYASNVEAQANSNEDFSTVVQRADHRAGFTVTTEANLVGSSISSKEALVAASACDGGETVGAAPNCVSALTDMTIMTGVTVADGESYQALPFIAINNDIQSKLVAPMSGRYKITGEVIDFQNVHPGFSGQGILIYEMERVGDVRLASGVEGQVSTDKDRIVAEIREQLEVHPSEYESYADSKQQQNPISESSGTETDENAPEQTDGRFDDVAADGNGFSMTGAVLAMLISALYLRRRGG